MLPEVCYNLLDVNGDGVLDLEDAFLTVFDVCHMGCGASNTIYFTENRYDLTIDTMPGTLCPPSGHHDDYIFRDFVS